VIGETHFIEGRKYLCCSIDGSGFAPFNHAFPLAYLLVPDDNSVLANSILNIPDDGGDFFTIPLSDLKLQPSFLKKGSSVQDAFCVKSTNRVKKITEKELGPFQTITFKVLSQKQTKKEESGIGSYHHELEIEPFSLGIEGLPEISRIVFDFGYAVSLENAIGSLMKTKLYNSKLLAESAGKTFTMRTNFLSIGEDNENDDVLTFSNSENIDLDSFQEKTTDDNSDNNNPPPSNPPESNGNSTNPAKDNKGLIIGGAIIILVILSLIIGFLVLRKRKK
jgi:hypothetical protein